MDTQHLVVPSLLNDHILNGLRAIREVHHLVAMDPDKGPVGGMRFDLSLVSARKLCLKWVNYHQKKGRNIYFHANRVKDDAVLNAGKAGKEDISYCNQAQADIDPPLEGDWITRTDAVVQRVDALCKGPNPPTTVIWSGNGANLLWKLNERMWVGKYDQANAKFNAALGVSGTHNADRVLKVPGTVAHASQTKINKGYPPTAQASLGQTLEGVYSFDDLPSAEVGGAGPDVDRTSRIPVPVLDEAERDALRELVKAAPEVWDAINETDGDGSAVLVRVASACRRNNFSRETYAAVVAEATRSAAHAHVFKYETSWEHERALGRAWDFAGGVAPQDDFDAVSDPSGAAPSNRDQSAQQELEDVFGASIVKKVAARDGPFFWADEAAVILDVPWLLKGLIPPQGLGCIYGAPGTGKSAFALDMVCRMSLGLAWHDHVVKKQGMYFYVQAEGGRMSMQNRISGWTLGNGGKVPQDVGVFTQTLRLGPEGDTDVAELAGRIGRAARGRGVGVAMVVIDTLSRNMAGDENATRDMAGFVAACDELRSLLGCFVMLVHHTGKDASKGARGNSALHGALDLEINLDRERVVGAPGIARVSKLRDGTALGREYGYALKEVELGRDMDGDKVTTVCVELAQTLQAKRARMGAYARALAAVYEEEVGSGNWIGVDELAHKTSDRSKDGEFPEVRGGDYTKPSQFKRKILDELVGKYGWSQLDDAVSDGGETGADRDF